MNARSPVQEVVEAEPTHRQLERATELRRFNRLFVYAPVLLASAIAIAIVILLLFLVLVQPSIKNLRTISAIADAAVILGAIPPLAIGGILLSIIVAIVVQARRRDFAPLRETQLFLWRVDRFSTYLGRTIGEVALKVASPFVQIRALGAYLRTFVSGLKRIVKRN